MNPNLDIHPSEPLDLLTLAVIHAEVERRAAECCQTWRLFPSGAGLVQAQTLGLFSAWLDEQIASADAALDRWALTEAGRAALAAAEKGAAA